jgi:ribosomal protein L40E
VYIEVLGTSTAIMGLIGVGVVACCGSSQQQQQQISVKKDDSTPKRVCPECGMENPTEASYCGDCGFNFTPSDE